LSRRASIPGPASAGWRSAPSWRATCRCGFRTIRANPATKLVSSKEAFWTYFMGFKIDKPEVNDETLRRGIVMAVDQAALAKNLYFGEVEPAYSYISQQALDWNKKVDAELIKTDVAGANKLLDEAGFAKGPDGFRVRNGEKIEPLLYGFTGSTDSGWPRPCRATCARSVST
jgi:peptide/nickel transport system substrate-binding protein